MKVKPKLPGVLLVLFLGFLARSYGLGAEDPWIDEVQSIDTSAHDTPLLLARTAFVDVHPPLYYLMLKTVRIASGSDLGAMRWFSIIAGLATLLLLAWPRSEEVFERNLRLTCAGLLALHAGHIHFSQEIRAYAWLCLALLGSMILLRRLLRAPTLSRAVFAALVMAFALWLHHVAWIYLAGMVSGLVLFCPLSPRHLRWLGVTGALTVVFIAAWFPLLVHQSLGIPEGVKAHVSGFPDWVELGRILGPWGGMSKPITVLLGLMVFLWIPLLTIWRQRGEDTELQKPAAAPGIGWMFALAAASLLLSMTLVFVIPRPELAEMALSRTLGWSMALITALPLVVFYIPSWVARIPTRRSFVSTHAMILGLGLALMVFLLAGHLGESRLFLPFAVLLLEASCVDAARANLERERRVRILPIILVLILPALPSAFVQAKHVQVRPDVRGSLDWAMEHQRGSVYVYPCFDAPAFLYTKTLQSPRYNALEIQNHCERDEDGRLTLSPPTPERENGLVVFTRHSCSEVERQMIVDPVLKASKAQVKTRHQRKGLCLVELVGSD